MSPKEPLPIFRPSRYLLPTRSSIVHAGLRAAHLGRKVSRSRGRDAIRAPDTPDNLARGRREVAAADPTRAWSARDTMHDDDDDGDGDDDGDDDDDCVLASLLSSTARPLQARPR